MSLDTTPNTTGAPNTHHSPPATACRSVQKTNKAIDAVQRVMLMQPRRGNGRYVSPFAGEDEDPPYGTGYDCDD